MNWIKAIGYGIALFAIVFLIGSIAMFGLNFTGNNMSLTMLVSSVIVVYLLAQQYKVTSINQGVQVGLVWLVVDAILEYTVIVQIFNKGNLSSFYTWSVLTGYALIVIIPVLVGSMKKG